MAHIDVKKTNPTRYALVRLKQEEIQRVYISEPTLTIECPYCHRKIGRIFRGVHGAIECKCDRCGEVFIFPPVSFSRAITG